MMMCLSLDELRALLRVQCHIARSLIAGIPLLFPVRRIGTGNQGQRHQPTRGDGADGRFILSGMLRLYTASSILSCVRELELFKWLGMQNFLCLTFRKLVPTIIFGRFFFFSILVEFGNGLVYLRSVKYWPCSM